MTVKRALLIGINYIHSDMRLNGCINDIMNVKNMLITEFGYKDGDIIIMTDITSVLPTRVNILNSLLTLITCGSNEIYFHYSGHGTHTIDYNKDEADGQDEALVPIDYDTAGCILDDELRGLLQCLNENIRLTMVLDCCHSGTGVDLTYNLYERSNKYYLLEDPLNKMKTRGKVICFSGCRDDQTSADAYEENQYQGALTYALISACGKLKGKTRTYGELFRAMKNILYMKKYDQIPCLSSGTYISLNDIVRF